jgi:hypothetical protein
MTLDNEQVIREAYQIAWTPTCASSPTPRAAIAQAASYLRSVLTYYHHPRER